MKLVTKDIYRGPRPETKDQKLGLLTRGVRTILSLESDFFETFTGRLNSEIEWAVSRSIVLEHIELSPILIPRIPALKAAVTILHHHQKPIYVHCKQGVDRTGMVCAAYRIMVQNWSVEKAVEEMLTEGFHKYRYWYWINQLKRLK